jgi:TolA-binding protein
VKGRRSGAAVESGGMSTPLSASTRRVGRASAVGVAALAACLALVAVCAQPDVDTALLQPGSGEALVWTRQAMKQMAISKLRQEHRELEGKLKEVRERLENRRLERKVVGLQRDIQALRQRAARAGAVGASAGASDSGRRPQMLRVEYKGPWSKSLAQSSFTDDDNPLYNASPADKVMDPEERPFLRGPGPHRGDLAHPETVRDLPCLFLCIGDHERRREGVWLGKAFCSGLHAS